MAEHLFKVQQATNFDTATLNDPFLIFKKKVQLERAKNTIISDVDVLVKNSFKNVLKDTDQQVKYTRNEENIHALVGIKIINTIQTYLRNHSN